MIRVMDAPKSEYPRNLGDDFKLSYRSIAEVYEAFSRLESRVAVDKTIRYKGNVRPKGAAILNALILYVESLPIDEQRRMIRDGMGQLNELLKLGEPGEPEGEKEDPAEREAGSDPKTLNGGGRIRMSSEDPAPKKKRSGGRPGA